MGNVSNRIFNKLQLELLLSAAEQASVPLDEEFCFKWIDDNSERLRTYWNSLTCKTCKFNTNCSYIYEILKRELDV